MNKVISTSAAPAVSVSKARSNRPDEERVRLRGALAITFGLLDKERYRPEECRRGCTAAARGAIHVQVSRIVEVEDVRDHLRAGRGCAAIPVKG